MAKEQPTQEQPAQELATTQPQETAIVAQKDNRGFENTDLEGLTMPVARLLQPISKEVADESYADYNFRAGMIINSLLLEKLSDTFIPLTIWEDKICFAPKQDAQKAALKVAVKEKFGVELTDDDLKTGFVCRANDNQVGSRFGNCANCGLCEFNGNTAPFCTKNINVLSLYDGQDLPVVTRFSNTSFKHGRAFKQIAFFASGGTRPLFQMKYKAQALKKTDGGNTWYEFTTKPAGKCSAEEFEKAAGMYEMFKKVAITVDDGEAPESPTAETKEF